MYYNFHNYLNKCLAAIVLGNTDDSILLYQTGCLSVIEKCYFEKNAFQLRFIMKKRLIVPTGISA